jgi:hypothetical protein
VAVVQYVGMTAWHQNAERVINTLPIGDVTGRQAVAGGSNANISRIYPGYASITQIENTTNSNYNSFQAGLRMQSRHNLTFQLSYTYAHEIDIMSGDVGSTNQQGSGALLSNPFNTAYDRGSGTIDRRNVFTANYIYSFPSFQSSGAAMRILLGGWQFAGVTQAQSGNPVNVTYSPDVLGLGGDTTNRPNFDSSARRYPKKQQAWFNTGAYTAPTAPWNGGPNQGFGTAGKDSIVGPGLFNWNLSLYKEFRITSAEGPRFQLRFESYNSFNHTEWNNIDTGFTDGNFGQVTSTFDPRTWQFGGKFLF